MRVYSGNTLNEAHGQEIHHIDFIAPHGSDPEKVVADLETAMGVVLHGNQDRHGYVNTSQRKDGLYVSVSLYGFDCAGCSLHPGVFLANKAPDLSTVEKALSKYEHDEHKLTDETAISLLPQLGFLPWDGAMGPHKQEMTTDLVLEVAKDHPGVLSIIGATAEQIADIKEALAQGSAVEVSIGE